ncbi:hypothetical protein M378DRAFT_19322 [Amanita muscaria Koide BX008]|uniref:Uncharacterized protein n=1 Tax=Amanita muscaria (strain Koide BX008) TaxID=946122 RepID=A0A0C2SJ98_AMAMK|nr:hypothetical protein M378DRAFT_19322 [Amanita muscaria Koide BX008]
MRTRTPSATVEDVEEHPAESDEPQPTPPIGLVRCTSPAMTPEDWDRAHATRMCAAMLERTQQAPKVFNDLEEVRKDMQKSPLYDLGPTDEPEIMYPLEGGAFVDFPFSAKDLLALNDDEIKKSLDEVLEAQQLAPLPFTIAVEEVQEKERLTHRIKRIYNKWPGLILFAVNEKSLKKAPNSREISGFHQNRFCDYRRTPPNKTLFWQQVEGIKNQYDEHGTGEMFTRVYMLLVLLSDYEWAFLFTRILTLCYHDVVYHTAQALINFIHMHRDYCEVQIHSQYVYDLAARVIQMGGDKYFDEVTRMVTSGMYAKPTLKVTAKAEYGLMQLAPRIPHTTKLEHLIDGLRFYHLQVTEDSKAISLDALHNVISYAQQMVHKLDEMKGHDLDYVKACVQIMEHGNALHGIDNPQPAMANTHFMRPRHVELDHVPYLLVPGNVKRFENETKRNPWQQICLKCGLSHFTNEHTCKIVYVDQDLQKSTPDNRFHPRRTEQFQGPEQPIRAQYYSDVEIAIVAWIPD